MLIFWDIIASVLSAADFACRQARARAPQISISPSFVPRGKFLRIAHCQTLLGQWDDINGSKLCSFTQDPWECADGPPIAARNARALVHEPP